MKYNYCKVVTHCIFRSVLLFRSYVQDGTKSCANPDRDTRKHCCSQGREQPGQATGLSPPQSGCVQFECTHTLQNLGRALHKAAPTANAIFTRPRYINPGISLLSSPVTHFADHISPLHFRCTSDTSDLVGK